MRRLLEWEKDAIVAAMMAGEKRESICEEFGVSRAYPSILARRRGIQARSNGRPRTQTLVPGQYKTPEHRSWQGMIQRCSNPKCSSFIDYGARGISVCPRWSRFKNFLDDMGYRPYGTTLDRINNDGNYEPDNCRWATKSQQNKNRRNRARVLADRAKILSKRLHSRNTVVEVT